mmetsp:Transcript_12170/g.23416  ORF Transcript_12170/g.23416 Transcript_12170/m.23416 type:complete len:310 (-) Transcript_12170:115-1044(-)
MKALLLLAYTCFAVTLHPLKKLVRINSGLDFASNPPPTLFIIGEQKCGTSSLFSTLRDHEAVCKNVKLDGESSYKELSFFDTNSTLPELISGFPRYLQHFAKCSPTQLRMESTPEYLSKNMTAPNIKAVYESYGQDLKSLRFLIIVRNPVSRVLSAYKHKMRNGHWPTDKTLGEFVNTYVDEYHRWENASNLGDIYSMEMTNIVRRGLYEHSIASWFKHFDPSQFIVLSLQQLTKDTPGVMNSVHKFLGLAPRHAEMHATNNHGGSNQVEIPEGLEQFYEPHTKALFKLKEQYPGSFYDTPENPFGIDM